MPQNTVKVDGAISKIEEQFTLINLVEQYWSVIWLSVVKFKITVHHNGKSEQIKYIKRSQQELKIKTRTPRSAGIRKYEVAICFSFASDREMARAFWTNQKISRHILSQSDTRLNQIRLGHSRFPAIRTLCSYSHWILIGFLQCFPSLWLALPWRKRSVDDVQEGGVPVLQHGQ